METQVGGTYDVDLQPCSPVFEDNTYSNASTTATAHGRGSHIIKFFFLSPSKPSALSRLSDVTQKQKLTCTSLIIPRLYQISSNSVIPSVLSNPSSFQNSVQHLPMDNIKHQYLLDSSPASSDEEIARKQLARHAMPS